MLDAGTKSQLKEVFKQIEGKVELLISTANHSKADELRGLINDVADSSDRITVQEIEGERFSVSINYNGKPTSITFSGVPGGHEFTSLILAILNTDGKGKWPDDGVKARIAALNGPIHLKTYISLSCTNCPDVVQTLNQMALIHDNFTHEMIDGGIYPQEIEALGLQGVPAVVADGKIVHVGKADLAEILAKLESVFGISETQTAQSETKSYDVVVVGGGPAGSAAAIYSARKGLKTAIVAERFGGQVKDTRGIENLISVTYTEGPHLAADLEKHVRDYDVDVLEHRWVEKIDDGDIKTLHIKGGEKIETPALIAATGAKWRKLNIPGETEYTGRGVAFCPHCDGPFYKGKDVAVIGGGNSGVEAAIDLAGICSHVTIVEFADSLKADSVLIEEAQKLSNVTIITGAAAQEVIGDGEKVTAIRVKSNTSGDEQLITLAGVFVQIGLVPNSELFKDVVEQNKFGEIAVDAHCRTSKKGIYAAGDVTNTPYKQIIISMGEGSKAALSAFDDRIRGII